MKPELIELTQKNYQELGLVTLTEAELLEELSSLQAGFTTSREEKLNQYAHEKKKASAYLQFYTPTNIPKLYFLLNRLPSEILSLWEDAPFIDFGAGPGTYSAAWSRFFNEGQSALAIVEQGEAMRVQAQKFIRSLYPDRPLSASSNVPQSFLHDKKSILFFGHVLNEMKWPEIKKLVDNFKGQAILWIEPGTSQAFDMTVRLRRYLLEGSFRVLFPCQSSALHCPAVQREGEWCHQVLRLTWPEWIERLAQRLKIDRRTMPLIAHAYQREVQSSADEAAKAGETAEIKETDQKKARVVRLRKETKHSFEWDICLNLADQLKWERVSVVKRGLSKKQQKKLSQINTGEEVSFEFIKLLDQNIWRVKLIDFVFPSP